MTSYLSRLPRLTKKAIASGLKAASRGFNWVIAPLPLTSRALGAPRGYVRSAAEFVRQYSVPGENTQSFYQLSAEQVTIPSPLLSLGGDPFAADSYLEDKYIITLRPGRVYTPNFAVITPDDRLLSGVSQWYGATERDHWIFNKVFLGRPHRLKGSALLLQGSTNYYHFLWETMSALASLAEAGLDVHQFDHILLHTPKNAYELEALTRTGISERKIVDCWNRYLHIEAEELTIISPTWKPGTWLPRYLRNLFIEHEPPHGGKRLYLSRRNSRVRHVVNEADVLSVLSRYGFTCLTTEGMTIQQQAELFGTAEFVVAPHGAGLTNLTFCKPGTKVLEFRSATPSYDLHEVYWRLSGLAGLPYYQILCNDADRSAPDANRGPDLRVNLEHLETALDYALR